MATQPNSRLSTPPPVKLLGLEFAPNLLHISWERRMQTFSVVLWFIIFIFWPAISYQTLLVLFFVLPNALWYILVPPVVGYLVWFLLFDLETPHRGGRPSVWVRNWKIWQHFNNFFPVKLLKTVDLDPSKNYLFCGHPHGLLCIGVFGCFGTEGNASRTASTFPGIKRFAILTFDASFYFPFTREIVLKLGLCSASRKSMNCMLSQPGGGNVAILIPGGAPEALDYCPGTYILQLRKRKGFIKVALQNGSPLVPVFSFGENTVLNQVPNPPGSLLRRFQDTFQKIVSIPPVLFYGRGVFQYTLGFLPKRKPITVVVGAPIPVQQVDKPSQQEIDELHDKYVEALTALFERHKADYSENANDTLVIK